MLTLPCTQLTASSSSVLQPCCLEFHQLQTHTDTDTHIYTHTCTHTRTAVETKLCTDTDTHTHTHTHARTCIVADVIVGINAADLLSLENVKVPRFAIDRVM